MINGSCRFMGHDAVEIDFVMPWVDGSDPAWREEFLKYRALQAPQGEPACDTGMAAGAVDASEERTATGIPCVTGFAAWNGSRPG